MEIERKCLNCGEIVKGRTDKKFCSDYCRNFYNNQWRTYSDNYIKKVNNTLKKNRKILLDLNPSGKTTVHKNQLLKLGFRFDFCTNINTTKNGNIYYFCYEQGYLAIDNDFYALVKKDVKQN
jgi:endogenous inhibitor of DNA gyrase (YacG/DUF329 family)